MRAGQPLARSRVLSFRLHESIDRPIRGERRVQPRHRLRDLRQRRQGTPHQDDGRNQRAHRSRPLHDQENAVKHDGYLRELLNEARRIERELGDGSALHAVVRLAVYRILPPRLHATRRTDRLDRFEAGYRFDKNRLLDLPFRKTPFR